MKAREIEWWDCTDAGTARVGYR